MRPAPRRDFVDAPEVPRIFLLPGTLHCSAEANVVKTVLGSCVAVCLCDRARGLSGINHFLLPQSGGDRSFGDAALEDPRARYGDTATELLVASMLALGSRVDRLEAKVFGGATVLPINNPDLNVGPRNVAVALDRLKALRIPVVAQRTGGNSGLAVNLLTSTGEVLVRRVPWREA
jgi:chemotaxis protein CheD